MDGIYNPKKLTAELQKAGLPVAGVSSRGRIDYAKELTKQQKSAADQIIAAHDPSFTDKEIEKQEIASKGVSDHDILMALWKKIIKADSTEADKLAEKIEDAMTDISM